MNIAVQPCRILLQAKDGLDDVAKLGSQPNVLPKSTRASVAGWIVDNDRERCSASRAARETCAQKPPQLNSLPFHTMTALWLSPGLEKID